MAVPRKNGSLVLGKRWLDRVRSERNIRIWVVFTNRRVRGSDPSDRVCGTWGKKMLFRLDMGDTRKWVFVVV